MNFIRRNLLLALLSSPLLAFPLLGQNRQPEPAPLPPPLPAPRDQAYAGPIHLDVDATDVQRRIMHVHETVPVRPGEVTLLYPQWIPGDHSPTGPIDKLAGLLVSANGKPVQWVRDRVHVFAFHVPVPEGASALDVQFDFLSPVRGDEGRVSMSNKIIDLEWSDVLLYPAGYFSRRIDFVPSVKLPSHWQYASALELAARNEDTVQFKTTPLNTLVDSPLYAGVNYSRVDLSTAPDNQVFLNLFGDTAESIHLTPQQLQLHKNLTEQAQKLYASHHYNHYDFLFLLSDVVGGIGLEHHQSSEDGEKRDYLTKWDEYVPQRDLLAHEYTHSWNGKFRRPADLWTPNFEVPMQDDLLWVYEGMTQYWGNVLTARAGLRTPEETRDLIASVAANFDVSPGRKWRPMVDTTNQPTISQRRPVSWVSWQRPEDYYTEGMLIWLDADTKIRELSGDTKSLDDFAKLFLGVHNGSFVTDTYTFEDVVHALNEVQPFDWASFLKSRVYQLAPNTPEDGFARGGYKLVYTDQEPAWMKHSHRDEELHNFGTGIGFSVDKDGKVENVWWDSPAFKAGMTAGMQITAVNGVAFKFEILNAALLEAEKTTTPLKFLLKRGEEFETLEVDYHGGLRYPKLQRVDGTPDRIGSILAAK